MANEERLSPETQAKLEFELDEATEQPGTSGEVPVPPRTKEVGAFAERRALIAGMFATAVVIGVIASLVVGSWWLLVLALAIHAVGTAVVFILASGLLSETEHASPELAEDLRAEGVTSPDRLLTDLVEERRDQ
jgi:hypothetical protein